LRTHTGGVFCEALYLRRTQALQTIEEAGGISENQPREFMPRQNLIGLTQPTQEVPVDISGPSNDVQVGPKPGEDVPNITQVEATPAPEEILCEGMRTPMRPILKPTVYQGPSRKLRSRAHQASQVQRLSHAPAQRTLDGECLRASAERIQKKLHVSKVRWSNLIHVLVHAVWTQCGHRHQKSLSALAYCSYSITYIYTSELRDLIAQILQNTDYTY